MLERLRGIPKEVLIGITVAVIVGWLYLVFDYVGDKVTDTPVTANISANDGQTSILPFFDMLIRPKLGDYCRKPAWIRWAGNLIWDRQCQRITFDPHTLADMQTRRVPFKESAEPIELMTVFIQRHKGCLDIELTGDTYRIFEPEDSVVIREGAALICP